MKLDLSSTGSARVYIGTAAVTLFCILVAIYVDSFNFSSFSPDAIRRSLIADVLIPLSLGGPLLFLLLRKVQQLAIAHREVSIVASTDSLTAVLNRGAFTLLVESYLEKVQEQAALRSGAFLVIDADYFKAINDSLGHQQGDVALKIIAGSIKANIRNADIVGRIGGEEFGVFLPDARAEEAYEIAERIRSAISDTIFPLGSELRRLSVTIGGVVFNRGASYDTLFFRADQYLYAAKDGGRNRVNIWCFDGLDANVLQLRV